MIVFARESFAAVQGEIAPLWEAHFAEVCRHQDAVPLHVDVESYLRMDKAGTLVVVTARRAGALVGYAFAIVGEHLHHRYTVMGQMDMYYLRRDCRGGRTAMRLFQAIEREVMAAGAVIFVIETLTEHNHSPLLSRLGYAPNEIMMTKLLRATG